MKRLALLCLAFVLGSSVLADDESGQAMPSTSPDGRFIVRQLNEDELAKLGAEETPVPGVFDTKTKKRVLSIPEDAVNSFTENLRVVWSKDSTRLAFNYQAGGRYSTTSLYKIDGTNFMEIPSPEETLSKILSTEKAADSKRQGLKPGVGERRIYDACNVLRWLDGDTVEMEAESISTVYSKEEGEDERIEVSASFRCTTKFDPKSKKWKILKMK